MNSELRPHISPSEKDFRAKYGEDVWVSMVKDANLLNQCNSCGFLPADQKKRLQIHIFDINEIEPTKTKCTILCNACHTICHIDKAIELDWVRLVNSKFSQQQLIQMSRVNQLMPNIENRSIVEIQKTPREFLEQINNGDIVDSKVKILFKSNFPWGDI